jgi:outer membrane lipopolysaccharide assembly protein LptE/RlpB
MNTVIRTEQRWSVCRQIAGILLLGFALLSLCACGYGLSGSGAQRLDAGQSLWVSFIGIEIDSPSAQTVLRRALLEEGHALRSLHPAATETAADLRVSGQLKTYSTRALSYSASDQVRDYALVIDVELGLYRKGETVPLWKGTLQGKQNYPANVDLAVQRSAEEAALAAASRIVAQKFISAVEQSY